MKKTPQHAMWTMGLSEADAGLLAAHAGSDYRIVALPPGRAPSALEMERDDPCLFWLTSEAWTAIASQREGKSQHLDLVPRVLVLEPGYSREEIERALDSSFTDVIKPPLTRARVLDVLRRAVETRNLYHDILRMTREIFLEREMLARKNDTLSFLVTFLTRATESLDPAEILGKVREDLSLLLPVTAVHGIFWPPVPEGGALEAELFVATAPDCPVNVQWVDLLLESARRLGNAPVAGYRVTHVSGMAEPLDAAGCAVDPGQPPVPGRVILMPLRTGTEAMGALAILTDGSQTMGKDQAQALDSAMKHLALALKNAMVYREVKLQADHDALTRLHNRRSLDERLRTEFERHRRYGHAMSLLLLDLDHFKAINDTYGHLAGDAVLRELADVLRNSIRTTDFAARYGGEEFVVILPHTDEAQGHMLAERLRHRIEQCRVQHHGVQLSATVSIGVAGFRPGAFANVEELVREADRALYLAKANGRNVVCTMSGCDDAKAAG